MAKENKPLSEHEEQVELFRWCAEVAYAGFANVLGKTPKPYALETLVPVPSLRLIHAIPNGGARGNDSRTNMIRGAMLKAEGVRKGVPDIFLPFASGQFHGLYIELKVADKSKGRVSKEQHEFINALHLEGYAVSVCYGAEEVKRTICNYYGWVYEN